MNVGASAETCNLWGRFFFLSFLLTWESFPGVRRKGWDVDAGRVLISGRWCGHTHILDKNVLSVHF